MSSEMFQRELAALEGVREDVARRSLGMARGATAHLGEVFWAKQI
jgi:hypothetical protein